MKIVVALLCIWMLLNALCIRQNRKDIKKIAAGLMELYKR